MPFTKPEDQQQFDALIELIRKNKPTDIEFYKEQWTANFEIMPLPAQWSDYGWDKPVKTVSRLISQPFNQSGPHWFYYKWKTPNILGSILTPAFDENGLVGLSIALPIDTSSEDLAILFKEIAQNDTFAAQIIEIDLSNCTNLTERIVFPKNLKRLQNLNMERISKTFLCENYDDLGPMVLFSTAKMGAPDLSALPIKRLNFSNTHLTEWPVLPKSIVEYVQYGSSPMSIYAFNLSKKALPNLRFAYFAGFNGITDAYAICASRMLQARPEVNIQFPDSARDVKKLKLSNDLLDSHFNTIVQDSNYANRVLVTEAELRRCASILYDMLVDAGDVRSQAIVASYIEKRLPAIIAKLDAIRAARAEREMELDGFVAVSSPKNNRL